MRGVLPAAAIALGLAASGVSGASFEGRARVVDGDTLSVDGRKVRLEGMDAPELSQSCTDRDGRSYPCGERARDAMVRMTSGRPVRCDDLGTDSYGRTLGRCHADGRDVGAALVKEGWALAFRKFSVRYVPQEDRARAAGRGMWAGGFEAPWDHRAAQRQAQARASSPPSGACDIKGNVSSRGRIYHLPGWPSYAKTRISERRGERWFCSEAEARAAGWRAARD